jgi:hypothetical protein
VALTTFVLITKHLIELRLKKIPMHGINDWINELHGVRFFFKIEHCSSYYQIPKWLQDQEKVAFKTHKGHYQL